VKLRLLKWILHTLSLLAKPKLIGITGATGFVGQHLVRALSQAGHEVRVLVRDRSKANFGTLNIDMVQGDLNDEAALNDLCAQANCIIHVAGAIAGLKRQDFFDVNETGTKNVAQAAKRAGVERFVHVSSLAAREPQLSHYAASKSAGEDIVKSIIAKECLVVVRPCAVYGAGDKATLPLIKALTQRVVILPGTMQQKISWVNVKDLVAGLVCLAQNEVIPDGVVEISDGKDGGYLWREMTTLAGQAQSRKVKLVLLPAFVVKIAAVFADLWANFRQKPDVFSRAKVNEIYFNDWAAQPCEIKGWSPQIGFEQGFAETLLWYQQNGWLPPSKQSATRHTE